MMIIACYCIGNIVRKAYLLTFMTFGKGLAVYVEKKSLSCPKDKIQEDIQCLICLCGPDSKAKFIPPSWCHYRTEIWCLTSSRHLAQNAWGMIQDLLAGFWFSGFDFIGEHQGFKSNATTEAKMMKNGTGMFLGRKTVYSHLAPSSSRIQKDPDQKDESWISAIV